MIDIPVNPLAVFPYRGFTAALHTDDILELKGFAAYSSFVAVDDSQSQSIVLTGDFGVYELYLGSEVFANVGNHGFTCEYGIVRDAFRVIKEPVQFLFVKGQ